MLNTIKRALISVSDKQGIVEFASQLIDLGIEVISTGGTYEYLKQNNLSVKDISSVTNFPEILAGRVKTLHPKIHGGILAKREDIDHLAQLQEHSIELIDLVCVNLYPFEETITQEDVSFAQAIENIDIGGPAMIRASAKNHQHVVIVTQTKDYAPIIKELQENGGIASSTRISLARKAFEHTAYYDSLITQYLKSKESKQVIFGDKLTIPAKLVQKLRYGENSHQKAAFYQDSGNIDGLLASFKQLQGKELSYNNLVDADTAWECVKQFDQPACVIVKHANPCGAAMGLNEIDSYKKAFASDPISSFGGIIAFNRTVSKTLAQEIIDRQFLEVLIAPEFDDTALEILAQKANIRVLAVELIHQSNDLDYKRIGGGILVQTPENKILTLNDLKRVSQKPPTEDELEDLFFAWNVAKFVKSNAIVLVKNLQVIGIGAGQMSRIDSSEIAVTKAKKFGFEVAGSVCASDAFFPFRDNVDLLAQNGIVAIIHPGGSIKDQEVYQAVDELGLTMITTSTRIFRH